MGVALQKLAEEDPTFRAYTNQETGENGMGIDRMRREFKGRS